MIYSRLWVLLRSWILIGEINRLAWQIPYAQVYLPNFSSESTSQLLASRTCHKERHLHVVNAKAQSRVCYFASRQSVGCVSWVCPHVAYFISPSFLSYKLTLCWHTLTLFILSSVRHLNLEQVFKFSNIIGKCYLFRK